MKSMAPKIETDIERARQEGREEALALVIRALDLRQYMNGEDWSPGNFYYRYQVEDFARDLQDSLDYNKAEQKRLQAKANYERVQKMADAIRKATS